VFAALERDHRAEHCKPQEQDSGEFVRPDQRLLEKIARRNTGEQHDDFGDDEQRGHRRDGRAKQPFCLLQGSGHTGHPGRHEARFLHEMHGDHPMLPAYFCSNDQA
jgi:hypothetical protein